MKSLDLRRWPRCNLPNAYLVVLAVILAGAIRMTLQDPPQERDWWLVFIVGGVAAFWAGLAVYRSGPRRLRLEVSETHLRVVALGVFGAEVLHDLPRADLQDLWLRERYPNARGVVHLTGGSLTLMACTPGNDALPVLTFRDTHLQQYDPGAVLDWLTEQLDLGPGM